MNDQKNGMSLIIFSNDFDKAMAAFILATGASSSGMEVTMFFTFWGLSLLRKKNYKRKGKTLVERMFGFMLPEGPGGTSLSKMNFLGAGTKMMKSIMRKKEIFQLEDLMDMAKKLDVKIVACTTSMEIMGIKREELIDDIDVGGVATYLGSAKDSSVSLFI
ncbi:DsrE/DsrF/DrsH-like family protein [Candidatus Latescibacterota bacterium]